MKIVVRRNNNNDLKAGAQVPENFFTVTDESGNKIGDVVFAKNIPLSFGGTEIIIEIDEGQLNGKSESKQ